MEGIEIVVEEQEEIIKELEEEVERGCRVLQNLRAACKQVAEESDDRVEALRMEIDSHGDSAG